MDPGEAVGRPLRRNLRNFGGEVGFRADGSVFFLVVGKSGASKKWDVKLKYIEMLTLLFYSRMCIFWLLCYTWRICFVWDAYFILLCVGSCCGLVRPPNSLQNGKWFPPKNNQGMFSGTNPRMFCCILGWHDMFFWWPGIPHLSFTCHCSSTGRGVSQCEFLDLF